MRIIAGLYKGRVLKVVPGKRTRPTTNRVREAWASTLMGLTPRGGFESLRVLDAFAGSGALGLELLSRGAGACVFFERDRTAFGVLQANIASLSLDDKQARDSRANTLAPTLPHCLAGEAPFDLVLLDPPYALPLAAVEGLLVRLCEGDLLASHVVISHEHAASRTEDMDGVALRESAGVPVLRLARRKEYGTICLDYYTIEWRASCQKP